MAVRRSVVTGFGGLEALADQLADDYMLGHLTVAQGRRVAVCDYVVENVIGETSLRSALLHELRWARTISRLRPVGFALSLVTDTLPVCLLAASGQVLEVGHDRVDSGHLRAREHHPRVEQQQVCIRRGIRSH